MSTFRQSTSRLAAGTVPVAAVLAAAAGIARPLHAGRTRSAPLPARAATQRASHVHPSTRPSGFETTLLDETGRLAHPALAGQSGGWRAALRQGLASPRQSAWLHLWLGEYELGALEQPDQALWHFREAERRAGPLDRCRGLAAYDSAIALFYAGRYPEAAHAFRALLHAGSAIRGLDRRRCALWSRHAGACAGYHAAHARMGVPEPQALDPLCAAAGLAVCLRSLSLPYDRARVSAAVRHTGEGSSADDLLRACRKLGVVGRAVRADDLGLRKLPKPLVAYVERDHFVAVVRADARGVSYVCSDCGCWPGGRVDLTWKQWHALDPGVFVTVSRPDSRADRLLAAVLSGKSGEPAPLRLASAAPLSRLHVWGLLDLNSLIVLLKGHVFLLPPGTTVVCGGKPTTMSCVPSAACPMDPAGAVCHDSGPSAGDPVNVATGEEEYQPAPDLVVYNPHGPAVVWRRIYNSLRGTDPTYESDDFGIGWSQPYNAEVYDPAGYSMNPLVWPGDVEEFLPTGTDAPAGGLTWDVLLNGTIVASSSSPSGWDVGVDFSYPYYYLSVSAPTTATVAANYEVRYEDTSQPFSGTTGPFSAFFDVPAAGSIPQGAIGDLTVTGTDHPATDPLWDIVLNSTIVASSTQPNGWQVINGYFLQVTAAPSAAIGSGYEVRYAGSPGHSAFFSVEASRFHLSATTKYLYLANGSRIPFTPPSVPTASQPQVICTTGEGQPVRVEWDYDASSIDGHYTLTWTDGTKWVTGTPAKIVQTPYVTAPQWWSNPAVFLPTQITDRNGNALTLQYSGTGSSGFPLLSKILDASNGTALLTINRATDGTGNITSVADAYGRSVYYQIGTYATNAVPPGWPQSYQEVSQVSQIVQTGTPNPAARWTYGYADFGNTEGEGVPYLNTIAVPSPTGTGTSRATINYDNTSGLVTSVVDADGNSRNYSPGMDSSHVQVTIKDSGGAVVYTYTIGFDNSMNETTVTDGTNSTVVVTNSYGDPSNPHKPTSVTIGSSSDGSAHTTAYTWGPYGRLASVTSPRGTVTNYTWKYDAFPLGLLSSVQEGTRTPTSFTYDSNGNLSTISTPAPAGAGVTGTVTTSFLRDSLGNVTQVTEPGNNNVDPMTHQPLPIVTSFNYTTDGAYSQPAAVGQALTITDNLGKVTHLRYSRRGTLISIADPLGNQATISYNLADQPVEAALPHTGQTGLGCAAVISRYLYPGGPQMMAQQYDESGALVRQATTVYGPEGERLADKIRNAAGTDDTVASYSFDAAMRLVGITDGNNHRTSYGYNQAGYLSSVTYPGGGTIQFPMYDKAGRPLQRLDGNMAATYYGYADPDGLLSDIQYPPVGGQPNPNNVHLTYDPYDRRATMADGTGSVVYGYDDADNIVSVATTYAGLPTRTVSYTFYPNNSRQAMTTPAGTFTYLYDLATRLIALTNPASETSQWTYLDNGALSTQQLANGVTSFLTYNARTFLTDLQNKTSGGTLLSEFGSTSMAGQMLYDAVGNRLQMNVTIPAAPAYGGATTYTVDPKDQLQQEQSTRQLGSSSGYTNGFLYDLAGNPTTFRNAANSFNANNQSTASGYMFDGNGSPTLYKGSTLAFDLETHLTQIGASWTAGYTGDGLRAWKQNGSTRVYFLYDGTIPVLELDSSGAVTAVNTFGANGLLSRRSGGASTFYTFDPQGSVCQRLNSAGTVLSTDMYDGYGVGQSTASSSDPWAFGAQWGYSTDRETGLLLLTNRYYDPGTGRFVTRDPAGYGGGINLYGYAGNSPASNIDPSGLCPSPRDWLWDFSDLVSGFGYAVTGGAIQAIWKIDEVEGYIDRDSGWFHAGQYLGIAHVVATVGVGTGAFRWLGVRLATAAGGGAAATTSRTIKEIGDEGEEAVSSAIGIARNIGPGQVAIPGTGPGGFRVPDFDPNLTIAARNTVVEVKNVKELGISPQLRDLVAYAQSRGVQLEIFTNAPTPTGELGRLVQQGAVKLTPIP